MTDTKTDSTSIDPMLELTSEQLARLAALVHAGELIRSGGLTRGNPGNVDDMLDLAEYVITGHTVVRTIGKKGRQFYMRVDGTADPIGVAAIATNTVDPAEVAA